MVRYKYINNQILKIYTALPKISFPLNVRQLFELFPDCRCMSYQRLANICNCSIEDIISLCESESGCTHYDTAQKKYLVLYNKSTENNNNSGRQRWTCVHELGHIICKHICLMENNVAGNNLCNINSCDFEHEADYFAATLLSPFPLFKTLNINSSKDVQTTFGLSREASKLRYLQYLKWNKSHLKTYWENDMKRLYKCKH